MFEEFEHLENTVPSEVLIHQVHKTIAGFEPQILSAIQILEAVENWVSHKKLLELINLTKNELYCTFENPYAILRVYQNLEEMKQEKLDLIPEDFTWYRTFIDALEPVYELISIPLKLVLLKKNDEELYAIVIAQRLQIENNLNDTYYRKLEDIKILLRYLRRNGQEKEIYRLASMGELIYPAHIRENF